MASWIYIILAGLLVAGVAFTIYLVDIYEKTNRQYSKLINVCETVHDLNMITKITISQHFKENLHGRDPLKLYPTHIQERYRQKYG